jgi:hypothetical protein
MKWWSYDFFKPLTLNPEPLSLNTRKIKYRQIWQPIEKNNTGLTAYCFFPLSVVGQADIFRQWTLTENRQH